VSDLDMFDMIPKLFFGLFMSIAIISIISSVFTTPVPLKPKNIVTLIPGDQLGPYTYNGFTDNGGGLFSATPLTHLMHLGGYIITFYNNNLPQNFTVGGFKFMVWNVDSTLGTIDVQTPPTQLKKVTLMEELSEVNNSK